MQLAVYPGVAGKSIGAAQASTADGRAKNQFLIGSIAVLGASVIMANPVASAPVLADVQHRAVQLVAEVTDPPATVYQDLINNTVTNISNLAGLIGANPFPILSTIAANQQGYAQRLATAIESIPTNLQTWYQVGGGESAAGSTYFAAIQAAIEAGDFDTAYNNFNKVMLFTLQAAVTPITGVFLSTTNRTTGVVTMGVIQQMAQNFADGVGALFNSSTLINGAFQSVFSPISGAAYETSRAINAISQAVSSGDVEGALTAIVNTPAVIADAFLNGFQYDSATNPWAGLLSTKVGCTGRCSSGGPIAQFLSTIPSTIATAIANTTTTSAAATSTTTTAATTANALSASTQTKALESAASDTVDSVSGSTGTSAAAATLTAATGATSTASAKDVSSTETAADDATSTKTDSAAKSDTKNGNRLSSAVKKLTSKLTTTKSDAAAAKDSSSGASTSGKKDGTKAKSAAKKASKGSGS